MTITAPKKRLLLVTDQYWPCIGGVEQWVCAVAGLMMAEWEVTVLCHAKSVLPDGLAARNMSMPSFTAYRDLQGVPVLPLTPSFAGRITLLPLLLWHLPMMRRMNAGTVHDLLYRFYRGAFARKVRAKSRDADLVHCFSTSWLARLVSDECAAMRKPFIHSPAIHYGRWGDSPKQLTAYGGACRVAVPSADQGRKFGAAVPQAREKIRVVPIPLPASMPTPRSCVVPDRPFVLFVGRREAHKGVDLLTRAFERTSADVSLVVCGPGARIRSDDPRVVDLGKVTDGEKEWLLSNCSLFCLPSTDETFGIAFVEAMRHGKPVVACDLSPINEIVVNAVTGILVPPGDETKLSAALLALLDNRSLREEMGRRGRERYDGLFGTRVIGEKLAALYGQCLHSRKGWAP